MDAGQLLSQFIRCAEERRGKPDCKGDLPANFRAAGSPSGQQKRESKVRAEMQPLVIPFDREEPFGIRKMSSRQQRDQITGEEGSAPSMGVSQARSPSRSGLDGSYLVITAHRRSVQRDV